MSIGKFHDYDESKRCQCNGDNGGNCVDFMFRTMVLCKDHKRPDESASESKP